MTVFLTATSLEAAGIAHAFSTREAGRSPVEAILPALGIPPERLVTGRQVHGDTVAWVAGAADAPAEGCDGLATRAAGCAVGVLTADCVPLLLADRGGRAVCAVHSGWRGTAASIATAAVERLRADAGIDPAELIAAIGPAVGGCCYEVSDEVADAVRAAVPAAPKGLVRPGARGRPHVDLRAAVRAQLVGTGVPDDAIETVGGCTACVGAVFYSHRRDGAGTGRQLSLIRLAEPRVS